MSRAAPRWGEAPFCGLGPCVVQWFAVVFLSGLPQDPVHVELKGDVTIRITANAAAPLA